MRIRAFISIVALIGMCCAIVLFVSRLISDSSAIPPHDFVEYWSAGHLNWHGQNPYDPIRMYALEKDHIGWDPVGQAIMMWNPPWTLSFVMPLGMLPWKTAQFLWLFIRLGMLIGSALLLRFIYSRNSILAGAIIFTWIPCYIALQYGQIPPLMLLGFALFLANTRSGRPFLAGLSCVLIAVKPHLAIFLWLGVARDFIVSREWRIIAGGIAGGILCSIWPLIQNPEVFHQYFDASRTVPPVQWISPTIGAWIRVCFRTTEFWPQWIPLGFGLVWFGWDSLRRRGRATDWADQIPALLLMSLVCAPYGCWPYDLTLLVIPILALANRRVDRVDRVEIAVYAVISLGILIMSVTQVEASYFVWVAPSVLFSYLVLGRRSMMI